MRKPCNPCIQVIHSHVKPILVLYFSVKLVSALAKYDVRIEVC